MDNPIPKCVVDPGECAVMFHHAEDGTPKYIVTNTSTSSTANVIPLTAMLRTMSIPSCIPQAVRTPDPEDPGALRCTHCFQECERVLVVYEDIDYKKRGRPHSHLP